LNYSIDLIGMLGLRDAKTNTSNLEGVQIKMNLILR